MWLLTTGALGTERDFRQVVVDYAAEAASHGAVYVEGIFTPAEPAGADATGMRCSQATATGLSRQPSSTACKSG